MTHYKIKMTNGSYINATGDSAKDQKRDAQQLASRFKGKVVRVGERR